MNKHRGVKHTYLLNTSENGDKHQLHGPVGLETDKKNHSNYADVVYNEDDNDSIEDGEDDAKEFSCDENNGSC